MKIKNFGKLNFINLYLYVYIGAIDGTFIKVKAPSVDPESYNCRKKVLCSTIAGKCSRTTLHSLPIGINII